MSVSEGRPLRICFVSSAHPSDDKRVHYKQAMSLVRAGFDVSHVVRDTGQPEMVDGVRLVKFEGAKSLWNRAMQVFRVYKAARSVPADVYHCNEVDSWLVGLFLKRKTGAKLIFDIHEIYSSNFAENRVPRPFRPLVMKLFRLAFRPMVRGTDHMILAKQSVAVDYPESSREKQIVISNYVELDDEAAVEPVRADDGQCVMIHLGGINRQRGWPQMLEAFALAKSQHLSIRVIGSFWDGTDGEFLDRARELGVADRVEHKEWIPYETVPAATRECHIGLIMFQPVLLNFTHAMPHKLFDYMLAGLPVIVPDFAVEVAQIVRETEAGLIVDVSDPAAIAEAFDRLANDPELRRRLGENGRKAVLETYNWGAEAERLIAFYRGLEGEQRAEAA